MTDARPSLKHLRLSVVPTRRDRAAARIVRAFPFRPGFDFMEDRTLLSTFVVSNSGDSGSGSLRQAIVDSNSAAGTTNTIDFDIPGSGVQTITPLSPLPAITNSVLIDGESQPGYAGTPLIELSGSQAGGGDGLLITGSDVTVRGLDINNFARGAGIHVTGTGATATGSAAISSAPIPRALRRSPMSPGSRSMTEPLETPSGLTATESATRVNGIYSAAIRSPESGSMGKEPMATSWREISWARA